LLHILSKLPYIHFKVQSTRFVHWMNALRHISAEQSSIAEMSSEVNCHHGRSMLELSKSENDKVAIVRRGATVNAVVLPSQGSASFE